MVGHKRTEGAVGHQSVCIHVGSKVRPKACDRVCIITLMIIM